MDEETSSNSSQEERMMDASIVVSKAIARECRLPRRRFEGNVRRFEGNMATTTREKKQEKANISEEEWDVEAGFSHEIEKDELEKDTEAPAFTTTTERILKYKKD